MLCGPAFGGFCAVIVGPDQLVHKTVAPKNHVAHDLGVVNLTPVQVQVEGAVLGEQTVGLPNARLQKRPVVLERIMVACEGLQGACVAFALEPGAVTPGTALLRGGGFEGAPCLRFAGVKRRVNVDDGE